MFTVKKSQLCKYLVTLLVFVWYLPYAHCASDSKTPTHYEENIQSLIDRDPFRAQIKESFDDYSGDNEDYAFNSVIKKSDVNGGYDFSVTNRLTGKSYWLSSENTKQPKNLPVQYYSFDEGSKALVLQTYDGLKRIPLTRSQHSSGTVTHHDSSYSYGGSANAMDDDNDDDDDLFSAASKELPKDALDNYRKTLESLKNDMPSSAETEDED